MTLSELIVDAKGIIGPGIGVSNDIITNWINDSYLQIVDEIQKTNPDYFTKSATADTVVGQQEYELPADFDKAIMVNIKYGGTWQLASPMPNVNMVPVHAKETSSNQGFSEGQPYFYILGDYLGFMPIPDTNYTDGIKLWYTYTPAALSADSDTPAIPSKYHHIIKLGVMANYLDRDEEHVAAERMRQRFDLRVFNLLENLSQREVAEPRSVVITQNQDMYLEDDINA